MQREGRNEVRKERYFLSRTRVSEPVFYVPLPFKRGERSGGEMFDARDLDQHQPEEGRHVYWHVRPKNIHGLKTEKRNAWNVQVAGSRRMPEEDALHGW